MLDLKIKNVFMSSMECKLPEEFDPTRDQIGLYAFWRINKQRMTIQEFQKKSDVSDEALPEKMYHYMFATYFEYILSEDADYRKKNDPALAKIVISNSFTCVYESLNPAPYSNDELIPWGKKVVVDDSWPYFRENLHATLLKMGLKAKILPSSPPRKSAEQLS